MDGEHPVNDSVLFLCPHGAAKSVIAAAYFDRLAESRGLSIRAHFAGTQPEAEIYPSVVQLLREEGIDVSGKRPRLVTVYDLAQARRVISIGCPMEDIAPSGVIIDRWDDIPPVSENAALACAAIRECVEPLFEEVIAVKR